MAAAKKKAAKAEKEGEGDKKADAKGGKAAAKPAGGKK